MSTSLGVIYAPFQTPIVTGLHASVLNTAFKAHSHVVVAMLDKRVAPTKDSPLDFISRESMIRRYLRSWNLPDVAFASVKDVKYLNDKRLELEAAVRTALPANFDFTCPTSLYADSTFGDVFRETGGTWEVVDGSNRWEFLLSNEQLSRRSNKEPIFSSEYRLGVINGLNGMFPISWPTVDMAIRRVINGKFNLPEKLYLFGKKPGENGWRFPGGFKDRNDTNFETAVIREAGEEILREGVNPTTQFRKPRYISSRNVNDWRYEGETDGITTLFYMVDFIGDVNDIKAGDDLADTAWFTLDEMKPEDIEGEHIHLYNDLVEFDRAL